MSGTKCDGCGKFIPYAEMDDGSAHFDYSPEAEGSRESCDWTCAACVERERRLDERTAEHGVWKS